MNSPDLPAPPAAGPGVVASLEGVRMRPVSTGALGEISADTLFTFAQRDHLIHARYAGDMLRWIMLGGSMVAIRSAS